MYPYQGAELTHEMLKEILDYDPETGVFVWKVKASRKTKVGGEAGIVEGAGTNSACIRITFQRRHYKAHRLAWFYVYGVWAKQLDHINGNRMDNRIANLRFIHPISEYDEQKYAE